MKFPPHRPTSLLLKGLQGIELGAAAHNPFDVHALNVAPADDEAYFARAQREQGNEPTLIDLYGHAAAIPLPDASQDFVLSSHVVEHIPDLFLAFAEWQRVLRPGGYVVMIVPLPTALPEDAGRRLTTVQHIEDDYLLARTAESHPKTIGHWHIFSCFSLQGIIAAARHRGLIDWTLVDSEDPDTKVGNGFWLAYKKGRPGA